VALYLLYRGIRNRAYFPGLVERLGFLPPSLETTGAGSLWFHAVSVGEALSAAELIRGVRARRPHLEIYLSTGTLAGREAARQRLAGAAQIFFAPLDYRSVVRRVLRRLRPAALVIVETEIWPNLYRETKLAGASLLVVNGRISDHSLPRYRALHAFFAPALAQPDKIFAQSEEDARRYVLAGAPPDRLRRAGNLKYDFTPPERGIAADLETFLDSLPRNQVWMAASTAQAVNPGDPDEDGAVIAAFQSLSADCPELLLILAPRRPERFDIVAEKLARAQVHFARRTALRPVQLPGVLLLDSIGELAALFARATVVFMGGTLASRGGHNILEPAYFGKPVIAGPHMENFAAIADEFSSADAIVRIAQAGDLAGVVARLLRNHGAAKAIGEQARALAFRRRGATDRIVGEILEACDQAVPHPRRTAAARLFFTPLSWIWSIGHRVRMASAQAAGRGVNRMRSSAKLAAPGESVVREFLEKRLARAKSLRAKVIAVGSLAMGGAGKSPVVAHLAELLDGRGKNVAILTRGYRRESVAEVIVPKGGDASREQTGDEAQIFIRAGHAHVGIGADRFRVGMMLEKQFAPDLFLLDDGFQHVRLKRDEDLVLVDALDPLGGGVFPLGRLREPFSGLARATAILITRVEEGCGTAGLERLIRRYNAQAPIFRARVIGQGFAPAGGFAVNPPCGRIGAFCGLGQPRSFWRSLDSMGVEVAFRQTFGDHHRYTPSDLRRLAARASATGVQTLATTEKDMMNLPPNAQELLQPYSLVWLKIGVEIENEEELLRRLGV
jgi:3-deoxy-D-manno-octulosonic-acid transferase